jgi:hypothetical protein
MPTRGWWNYHGFKDKYYLMLNIMFCMHVMLICIMYSVVHMNYC